MLYICAVIIKNYNVMEKVISFVRVFGGVEYSTVVEYTSTSCVYRLSYKGCDKVNSITFSSLRDYLDYICFLQRKAFYHV